MAKKLTELQMAQKDVLQDMKVQLANLPKEVLRRYLANIKPCPRSVAELETHTAAVIRKLSKTLRKCKRKLGSVVTNTNEQLSQCTSLPRPSLFPCTRENLITSVSVSAPSTTVTTKLQTMESSRRESVTKQADVATKAVQSKYKKASTKLTNA